MNLTLHRPAQSPLLIPLLPADPCAFDANDRQQTREAQLCRAITQRVAQKRPITVSEPHCLHCLPSCLELHLSHGVKDLLVLPWNLQQTTALLLKSALSALQHTGTNLVSTSSLLPAVAVPDVLPAGPLGGMLPPQQRLDRSVERWPNWRHCYTMVRHEQAAIVLVHTFSPQHVQPPDGTPAATDQLKQALFGVLYPEQIAPEMQPGDPSERRGVPCRKDGIIYARYLTGIVCAALDVLCSRPQREE